MSDEPTTVIVYRDGFIDPKEIAAIVEGMDGKAYSVCAYTTPADCIQVISDAEGLRVVGVEKAPEPA